MLEICFQQQQFESLNTTDYLCVEAKQIRKTIFFSFPKKVNMKPSYLGYKEFSNIDKLVTFSLPSAHMNGGNRIIVDESPNRRSVYQSV